MASAVVCNRVSDGVDTARLYLNPTICSASDLPLGTTDGWGIVRMSEFPACQTDNLLWNEDRVPTEERQMLRRWTLDFLDESMELPWRRYLFRSLGPSVRSGWMLCLAGLTLFGVLEALIWPTSFRSLWVIRYGLMMPVLLLITPLFVLDRYHPLMERYYREVATSAGVWIGCCLWVLGRLLINPANTVHVVYGGLAWMLCALFLYAVARVGVKYATAAGMFSYAVGVASLYIGGAGSWALTLLLCMGAGANIIGFTASHTIERLSREHFLALQKLEDMARHDVLTGLPNARAFLAELHRAVRRSNRRRRPLSVLYIDLDRFKPVNDTWGHAAGDRVLKVMAYRIEQALRDVDMAARLGGDEFVTILEDTGRTAAELVAGRLESALRAPVDLTHAQVVVGASVGVATLREDADTADELLRAADSDMFSRKHKDRERSRRDVAPGPLNGTDPEISRH